MLLVTLERSYSDLEISIACHGWTSVYPPARRNHSEGVHSCIKLVVFLGYGCPERGSRPAPLPVAAPTANLSVLAPPSEGVQVAPSLAQMPALAFRGCG